MHHDQFVKCSLGAGNDILLPVQTQATKQNGHPIQLKSSLLLFRRLPNERKLFTGMLKKNNVA